MRTPLRLLVSGMQFLFREGFSTIDAVTGHIREKISKGKVVLAVSLDIKNAFNSLSWGAIRWALERKKFPDYLRKVLDFYLSDRWMEPHLHGRAPVEGGSARCSAGVSLRATSVEHHVQLRTAYRVPEEIGMLGDWLRRRPWFYVSQTRLKLLNRISISFSIIY